MFQIDPYIRDTGCFTSFLATVPPRKEVKYYYEQRTNRVV